MFVHLHVHSSLSPNWGLHPPEALCARAVAMGCSTIALTDLVTVGSMTFNNTGNSYTIGAVGGPALTLDNGASNAAIANNGGSHVINAPITLGGNTKVDINVAAGASLSLTLLPTVLSE